ncbi:hypothetical protein AB0D32_19520 [Micromonospora sp. NPDC048170]|uniref:hypothetical protein n=1 Tax=Micromonospora sp. NPDC048170 TaxID=3154819 RepID=UPI0033D48B81
MSRKHKGKKDAQAVPVQLENRWPSGGTVGVVTTGGRTFHRDTDCPGYRQGVRQAEKNGRAVNEVETVSAAAAQDRGKAACRICWRRA